MILSELLWQINSTTGSSLWTYFFILFQLHFTTREKEITNLNNKKVRIRKAYIDELFTEEEYKEETSIIENKIKNLEKKLLENEQVSNLNLTIDDILIKRDMDFIKIGRASCRERVENSE